MKSSFLYFLVLSFSLILYSCSTSSFVDLNELKSELKVQKFPTQKDYPQADAVVLSDVHDVHLEIDEDYELETTENIHKVIKLFKNIDEYASVEIPVYSGNKVFDLAARTIKPDGTIVKLNKDDFHVITGGGDGYVFYSDKKTIKFTFPALEKNSIIEYSYSLYEPMPFVMDVWKIQNAIPELQNVYKLTLPIILIAKGFGGAGWDWRYKSYNCTLPKPEFQKNLNFNNSIKDQSVSYTWTQRNIPAFEPEPMMPPYINYLRYVKFAPSDWKTWSDISKWYYSKLFKPKLIITKKISDKAKELTKDCTTETEKIRSIFNFIQTLRYVAIELNEGYIQPSTPQKVYDRKYGDCKDKSILLIAMLKSLGIKAKPVLVLTKDEGKLDKSFPNWNFNHMIVKATAKSGKNIWIDPTVDHCNLGTLPYNDQDINVLVLNDDGTSKIEHTPSSTFKQNQELIDIKLNLAGKDTAAFNITMHFKGAYNLRYRNYFTDMTKKDIMKLCKSMVANNFLNADITDYSFTNLDSVNKDLIFNFKMKVPDAVQKQGDLVFLNDDPIKLFDSWSWLARDKRKYDIKFDFPRTINKTIKIQFPGNKYKFRNLPPNTILHDKQLYFSKYYEKSGTDILTTNEKLEIGKKEISAKNYKDTKKFFERLKSKLNEQVILSVK